MRIGISQFYDPHGSLIESLMTGRRNKLPPLNTLKAFDAVMRHGSLRAAAEDLAVTPQAVSQQVRLLEAHIQVSLFTRHGRAIAPTKDAVVLSRYVESGFKSFADGLRLVGRQRSTDRINLNVTPYFATRYLIPQLDGFRRLKPGCDLRLTTRIDTPDFDRDEIDVAIQWGYGDDWDGLQTSLLTRDHKVICCAPSILNDGPPLTEPGDLVRHTLLNVGVPNSLWRDILAHLHVEAPRPDSAVLFDDASSMRRATLAGMGIGLISAPDAVDDIKSGDLVAPFGLDALAEFPEDLVPGFYLILPTTGLDIEIITAFCDWIRSEDWCGFISRQNPKGTLS